MIFLPLKRMSKLVVTNFQASILKNLQRSQQLLLNSGSEHHNKGKYSRHDGFAMVG